MEHKLTQLISDRCGYPTRSVQAVVRLLEESCSVPFIARYRKEMTGSLDEVAVADIKGEKDRIQKLIDRKTSILTAIEEQGKLTVELRSKIQQCWDTNTLEDLYLPYKQKKLTRAEKARQKGLESLAKQIMAQRSGDIRQIAKRYLSREVKTVEQAISGAQDIIAEWISENDKTRSLVRSSFEKTAVISSKVVRSKEAEAMKYRDYFSFQERLKKCPSHRLLAMRRGEEEGLLRVKITADKDWVMDRLVRFYIRQHNAAADIVHEAIEDAYKRLLAPSIESEFKKLSKESADQDAIKVFVENLRQLLMDAPLGEKTLLAIDPGYRSGCKWVVLDAHGSLERHGVIYPHQSAEKYHEEQIKMAALLDIYPIEAVAVGNGTAGRETMKFFTDIDAYKAIDIFSINESGASIYSASEIARQEFPDLDLTVRGAISIGRRLMDPLAELVKIDPKSIGVGQYQHDVNQVMLRDSLTQTVEHVVNSVGINLNTASASLLSYVSGLGPKLAENIVEHRSTKGSFRSRQELRDVKRMGDKAFEQCAGFLRIRNPRYVLDQTAVHPERYKLVEKMAKDIGVSLAELVNNESAIAQINLNDYVNEQVGLPTLKDIIKELQRPGLDPRGKAKAIEFSSAVGTIDDLKVGMILNGIVTNITNFGAFVDIGIKSDGLVHISQITDRFIKSPSEVVSLNQSVKVKVINIDLNRNRVNLSMKEVN